MNTTNHFVSVIMPVFNGGNFLQIALESIRAQDYPNLEIIAVNDGSTDGSDDVLKSFSGTWPRSMKILTHPGRLQQGIAASYRLGLEHCEGKYIAFLEHDDIWQTNKISEQVKVFEAFPEVGLVFSDVYTCDQEGRVASRPFKTLINRPPTERPFNAFKRLLWGNYISTFSNIMVRSELMDVSEIITEPPGFQDWMLLLQLSNRYEFYHCRKTKIFWRQRDESYHSKQRKLPEYRKLRKLALKNTIANILSGQSLHDGRISKQHFSKKYLHAVVALFSASERIADFLNRQSPHRRNATFAQNASLKKVMKKELL